MKRLRESNCPISYSLDLFGDKWSLLVLRDMLILEKKSFREFLCGEEKISTNILADRLEALVGDGLVEKSDDPSSGRQIIYTPTAKGRALLPLLQEMQKWGKKYRKADPRVKAFPAEFQQ